MVPHPALGHRREVTFHQLTGSDRSVRHHFLFTSRSSKNRNSPTRSSVPAELPRCPPFRDSLQKAHGSRSEPACAWGPQQLRRGPRSSASSAYASVPVCWLPATHKRSSPPFTQRSRHTKLTLRSFVGVRRVHLWLSAPMAEGWCSSTGRPPCTCPSAGFFEGRWRCGGSPKHIFAQSPPPHPTPEMI